MTFIPITFGTAIHYIGHLVKNALVLVLNGSQTLDVSGLG